MDDGTMSINRAVAGVLWVAVICFMVAAWITVIWGPAVIAGMLAATGCATSAVAATAQIRVYTVSVCAHLRDTRAEIRQCRPEVKNVRSL